MLSNLFKSTVLLVVCSMLLSSCLFTGCEVGGNDNKEEVVTPPEEKPEEKPEPDPDIPFHADLANYDMVWSDEFNGTSLDKSAWNVQIDGDGSGNNELEYYRQENISLGKAPGTGEDCLILTAKKENFEDKPATSGRINTQGKKTWLYGRIDGRIRLPKTADGLWPAFWMMGDDIGSVGWPRCGEIDIMEMGSSNGISRGTQDRYFNGACHWGPKAGGNPMYSKDSTWSYSLQEGFNLWTLVWTPESIKMYLDLDKDPDVKPYYEMDIPWEDNEYAPGYYFNKPHHILLNLAVGGNFPGIHNIDGITALAGGPAHMYVDYVRVYQEKK